jgi:hypothetical protein
MAIVVNEASRVGVHEENATEIASEATRILHEWANRKVKKRSASFFRYYWLLNENPFRSKQPCLICRGGGVVNALASRSIIGNVKGWINDK